MLVFSKGEASSNPGKRGTYNEVKGGGSGFRKLLCTVFMLIVLVSTYLVLRNYDIIQADNVNLNPEVGDKKLDTMNEDTASQQPSNTHYGDASSSITLYNLLKEHDFSIGRGRASDGIELDCETDSLFVLTAKSNMILVEQEMECEKAYNVTSDSIYYKLHDTLFVSLVCDSGTYLWFREYIHALDEWNEAVFLQYKIPITRLEYREAKWPSYERIEIVTGYSEKLSDPVTGPYWVVTLRVRNSGSNVAIIDHVFVNDVPVSAYGVSKPVDKGIASESAQGLAVRPGESKNVRIFIDGDYGRLTTGTTINVKLHCESGMDYIKLITLS